MTEEQAQERTARLRPFLGINADVLTTPEEVADEKRRRIRSLAFDEVRRIGLKKEREARIKQIAQRMRASGWGGRSASWIAARLAPEWGLSPNTLRADVARAKKLMGSQHPKN